MKIKYLRTSNQIYEIEDNLEEHFCANESGILNSVFSDPKYGGFKICITL
ncbi:hypothetical protein [Chondrinema litorale]|nr:hypothetical protein [Chondrinema litorale]UZR96798.1 hypothetical protein OQ292_24165 [Chondrinema litorale]